MATGSWEVSGPWPPSSARGGSAGSSAAAAPELAAAPGPGVGTLAAVVCPWVLVTWWRAGGRGGAGARPIRAGGCGRV